MSFEKIMLYSFLGVFFLVLIISSRILPALGQISRIFAWRKFAKDAGLTFVAGSFFNSVNAPAPTIVGTYKNHSIQIAADTFGNIGFFDSFTQINISVRNPNTTGLSQGGFIYVKKMGVRDIFFDKYQRLNVNLTKQSSYRIYCNHENLGNFINRNPAFQRIIANKRFSGLVIQEQKLYFRSRNVDLDSKRLLICVDDLYDAIEAFEQYSQAWIK
ncbi:MAG: hypothetical protein HYZ22_02695 [Chloroflexi bacterium]|nr:hypothetical protein [Chloroflexota bacterium]